MRPAHDAASINWDRPLARKKSDVGELLATPKVVCRDTTSSLRRKLAEGKAPAEIGQCMAKGLFFTRPDSASALGQGAE
jgi:hypothetical protein